LGSRSHSRVNWFNTAILLLSSAIPSWRENASPSTIQEALKTIGSLPRRLNRFLIDKSRPGGNWPAGMYPPAIRQQLFIFLREPALHLIGGVIALIYVACRNLTLQE
jgi:hypothetical protein